MKPATVKHPRANEEWRDNLRSSFMRVGFVLSLSKPMIEYLCAVSDGVMWDRALYWSSALPDNFIASQRSLEKRGLVARQPQEVIDAQKHEKRGPGEWSCYDLTPAGKVVVELLKMAGLFVEADAAINRKHRRAAK